MSHIIPLSLLQVEILLETVESFVDNHKLLHVPDQTGQVVGLPLTSKALHFIHAVMKEKELTDKQEVLVEVHSAQDRVSEVTITLGDSVMRYEVQLDEFDQV